MLLSLALRIFRSFACAATAIRHGSDHRGFRPALARLGGHRELFLCCLRSWRAVQDDALAAIDHAFGLNWMAGAALFIDNRWVAIIGSIIYSTSTSRSSS